jgi:eukaryotic-like serine/threonine-protein kinase
MFIHAKRETIFDIFSPLSHPNCVSLIGLCPDEATGQVSLVLELCQHGSLEGFIQTRGAMNLVLLVQTLRDVARGLQHLHDSSLIHRDISARNILLSPSGAKIADFGLARGLREEQTVNKTAVAPGPLRWMAPEAFPGFFSPATDVHMFGMLMFEVRRDLDPKSIQFVQGV